MQLISSTKTQLWVDPEHFADNHQAEDINYSLMEICLFTFLFKSKLCLFRLTLHILKDLPFSHL